MTVLGVFTSLDRKKLGEVSSRPDGTLVGESRTVSMVSSTMNARGMLDLAELDGWSNGYLTYGVEREGGGALRSGGFNEVEHPRDPQGKFVKVGSLHRFPGLAKLTQPASKQYQSSAPTSELTDADRAVVKNYAWGGSDFERMNGALRGDPEAEIPEEMAKGIHALTDAISRYYLKKPTTLYRGVPDTPETRAWLGNRTGAKITDHGFMSTSTDKEVADLMADPTGSGGGFLLHIKAPTGTQAVTINDTFDADGGFNQQEVLLQRGAQFKVGKRTVVGGVTHVELSVLNNSSKYK